MNPKEMSGLALLEAMRDEKSRPQVLAKPCRCNQQ